MPTFRVHHTSISGVPSWTDIDATSPTEARAILLRRDRRAQVLRVKLARAAGTPRGARLVARLASEDRS